MEKGLCGCGVSTLCVYCNQTTCIHFYDVENDTFPNHKKVEEESVK